MVTWTHSLNMKDQIISLYHLPILIGALYLPKQTTTTVSKELIDVIQFSFPLTIQRFTSTTHVKRNTKKLDCQETVRSD